MTIRLCTLALLFAAAGAASAQAADPCATAPAICATLINTHATATTRLPNTAVDVTFGIAVTGKDLATVRQNLSAQSAALLGWLRGQKVERLMTADVNFEPEVKTQKNATDKTVGYNGTERVSFRTTPDKAPELLGAALDHGATSIDSTNFTPTEEEIAAARKTLSAEATRSAIAQAEAVAGAAGLHMVAVRSVSVEGANPVFATPSPRMFMMKAKIASAPVAVEAGDAAFSINVDVTVAAAR